MQFKDIVGQQDVANRLTTIIDSGRVSHAQMVLGNTEDGSLQLAWAYLQYLCCTDRRHYAEGGLRADSCGECPNCKKIASLQHPDLHLFFPTASDDKKPATSEAMAEGFRQFMLDRQGLGTLEEWYAAAGVDNKQGMIRDADADSLVLQIGMKPYEGGWRMVIVWMAEKMNPVANSILLKPLEEPMEHSVIMLVCENDERVLPTIRSRVQMVRAKSTSAKRKLDREAAETYGPMLVGWLRMLFKLKMKELSAQVDKMAELGREQKKQFLQYALDVMRDCFLQNAAGVPCHLDSGDEKFDAMFPKMITTRNIESINNALNDAIFAIERNAHGKIALMELSFRMSKALKKR